MNLTGFFNTFKPRESLISVDMSDAIQTPTPNPTHFAAYIISFSFIDQSLGAEKDSLDIIQHDWALPKFEHRAEAVLKKLVR